MNINFKCRHCDKNYKTLRSRWNHENKMHKDEEKSFIIKDLNICKYCKKKFSTNGNLSRHLINKCLVKNNNIIINNYKNPNINNFILMDICYIFDKEHNMILSFIEKTYFNKNIEENMSFYVSNLSGDFLTCCDNQKIVKKLKKHFFDDLFYDVIKQIELLYEKYKSQLFELEKQVQIQHKIQYLKNMKIECNQIYKSYIKLINILAYNNKELVINTFSKINYGI